MKTTYEGKILPKVKKQIKIQQSPVTGFSKVGFYAISICTFGDRVCIIIDKRNA